MNRDISELIGLLIAAFPLLFLVLGAGQKGYKKFRQRKAGAQTERQSEGLSVPHESTGPRRAIMVLIGMPLLVVVWGLMVGFAVGAFSRLIYIVFLMPLVMGINSGKLIVEVIQRAKIRTTALLILLSLLSAVVMYGAFHYTRYLGFQLKASLEIFSGLSEATETENLQATRAFLDYALEEETGHSGFPGYILYEAKQGATIGRLFRSSGVNLGPWLTWLYWLIELGIILGVTIYKGRETLGRSFCEACGNRYGKEKHLGGTAYGNEPLLMDLIRQKDFTGLRNLLEENAGLPSLEVYLQGCETCNGSSSHLVVRHAFQSSKGTLQFRDASQTALQPGDSALLLNQLRLA